MILKELFVKNILNHGPKLFLYFSNKYNCRLVHHLNMRILIHFSVKESWGFSHLYNKHPKSNKLIDS